MNSSAVSIRPQRDSDAADVRAVVLEAFVDEPDVADLEAALARRDRSHGYVAEVLGTVVGHVRLTWCWIDAEKELAERVEYYDVEEEGDRLSPSELLSVVAMMLVAGTDTTGDGTALNVRALYQRCPHLGCKPNPCLKNFWFECPCHGSRYDRLGIKADGPAFGPAPRSMDRFSITVDSSGILTINTGKITLGPLPVALGQPGLIPPRTPTGCI